MAASMRCPALCSLACRRRCDSLTSSSTSAPAASSHSQAPVVRESRQRHCVRKAGRDRHLVPIPLWRSPDQRRCPGKDGVSGYSHGNRIPLPETHTSWTMSSMSRSTLHMDTLKVDSRPASVIFPVSLGCPPPCGWKMVEDSSKKAGSKETLVIVALCANLRRRRPRSQERASEIVLE